MLKYLVSGLVAGLFLIFLIEVSKTEIRGQEPSLAEYSERKICLSSPEYNPDNLPEFDTSGSFSFYLIGQGLQPGAETYIYICGAGITNCDQNKKWCDETEVCTTGNPEYDQKLFGVDNTQSFGWVGGKNHRFRGMTIFSAPGGGKTVPEESSVNLEAVITNPKPHSPYVVWAHQFIPPQSQLISQEMRAEEGYNPSIQVGTMKFEQLFPTSSPDSYSQSCVTIVWDPYGRVFDSQSLEPMTGAEIEILDENKKPVPETATFDNPVTTGLDGVFNFLVKEGIYYLSLLKKPVTHQFTSNPNLHPNYSKIYVKNDGSSSIYKPDEPIAEMVDTPEERAKGQPFPEQRDIPLDPDGNPSYKSNPVVIEATQHPDGSRVIYQGRVSHPFAVVKLTGANDVVYTTTFADRNGFWGVSLTNKSIPQDQVLVPLVYKTDLTKSLPPVLPISAVVQSLKIEAGPKTNMAFQPVLRTVEGYAYDITGAVISNAKVVIRLNMNKAAYFTTQADSDGYFKIYSSKLPLFPFYLEFADPVTKSPTTQTTSDFSQRNKGFLTNNKISLMSTTNYSALSPTSTPKQPSSPSEQSFKESSQKSKKSDVVFIVIILIIFLLTVSATLFFYLRRKGD